MDDTDRVRAAAVLASIKDARGHLGTEFYRQIARFSISTAFEAVLLRRGANGVEVYMTERDPADQDYPGSPWHCPGSVFRRFEQVEDVVRRLSEGEFHFPITRFTYVCDHLHQGARGWFNSKIYLVEVPLGPESGGQWHPVDHLPENIIKVHRTHIIPIAVRALGVYDELIRHQEVIRTLMEP